MLFIKSSLLFTLLQVLSSRADQGAEWMRKPTAIASQVEVFCLGAPNCLTEEGGSPADSTLRAPEGTTQGARCYDPAKTFDVKYPSGNLDTVVSAM